MSEESTAKFFRPDGRELEPLHHLRLGPRGKYVLQLTVSADGGKFVGRRIVQQLRTRDAQIAMAKRDAVLEAFKLAGMLCRNVEMVEGEM